MPNTNLLEIFAKENIHGVMPRKSRYLPTGFDAFDNDVLITGGIPRGSLTHIYGPDGAGKTTLALRLVAQAQRMFPDEAVIYVDTEFRFNPDWAAKQGVDLRSLKDGGTLILIQDNVAENVLEQIKNAVKTGRVSFAFIDSIGNLYPEQEIDYAKANTPGLFARIMTKYLSPISGLLYQTETGLVCLNQIRDKIGVIYGSSEDFPGGRKLKHIMDMNIRVRKVEDIKQGDKIVGAKIGASVRKNGRAVVASSDSTSHMDFYNEGGFEMSKVYNLFDTANRLNIVVRGGAYLKLVQPQTGEVIQRWKGTKEVFLSMLLGDTALQEQLREFIDLAKRENTTVQSGLTHKFDGDDLSDEEEDND